jgi:hypothetical protein
MVVILLKEFLRKSLANVCRTFMASGSSTASCVSSSCRVSMYRQAYDARHPYHLLDFACPLLFAHVQDLARIGVYSILLVHDQLLIALRCQLQVHTRSLDETDGFDLNGGAESRMPSRDVL